MPDYRQCTFDGDGSHGPAEEWFEVTGWVKKRREGGTHAIVCEEPTGRWACNDCISKLRSGLSPGQTSLPI